MLSVRSHELRWYQQRAFEMDRSHVEISGTLMCHPQVLKDPENKRKVLERTPMRRIGETHEVSGAPGCHQEQLTVVVLLLRIWQSQRKGLPSRP